MSAELQEALAVAKRTQARSVETLAALVRIPSLTGEEGAAQAGFAQRLRALGAGFWPPIPCVSGARCRSCSRTHTRA